MQSLDTASIRSAPLNYGQYVLRQVPPSGASRDNNPYGTTRVLRVSKDLTGRKVYQPGSAVAAETNDNVFYSSPEPVVKARYAESLPGGTLTLTRGKDVAMETKADDTETT